jgi:anhydro-N-acetylmuramic acid kinase
MMRWLQEALAPFGFEVATLDGFGLPSQSKEAAAFALMAYETWHHRASNVPAATGAARPVILGQVIYSA